MEKWTVTKVKEEMPEVKILINGKEKIAYTSGRRNPFCEVWWYTTPYKTEWDCVDVAWETVCNCLNLDTAIIV